MTKRLFLLLAVALAAGTAAAQTSSDKVVQLGLRAGVFGQDIEMPRGGFKWEEGTDKYTNHYSTEGAVGFNVGIVSRIRLVRFGAGNLDMGLYFQPEINYSQNNYKIQRTAELINGSLDNNKLGKLSKIRMQSVEIPTFLSFKVSILRAQFGPVFKAMFTTKTVGKGVIKIESLRPLVGWSAGVSVDIVAGLVIDGRYSGQFKKLKNTITADGQTFRNVESSLASWSVGLAYLF